jgi:hypothetical protein
MVLVEADAHVREMMTRNLEYKASMAQPIRVVVSGWGLVAVWGRAVPGVRRAQAGQWGLGGQRWAVAVGQQQQDVEALELWAGGGGEGRGGRAGPPHRLHAACCDCSVASPAPPAGCRGVPGAWAATAAPPTSPSSSCRSAAGALLAAGWRWRACKRTSVAGGASKPAASAAGVPLAAPQHPTAYVLRMVQPPDASAREVGS